MTVQDVNAPDQPVEERERERGFLLIADMEGSTESKFRLGETAAFDVLREHNRLIVEQCRKALPVPGVILQSLGDAVVVKFQTHERGEREALVSCLRTAHAIVSAFEALPPIQSAPREFQLRTKLTLQYYEAFRYGPIGDAVAQSMELVGADIDAAFRISAVSWRLQVLATERFMSELLRHSEADLEADELLQRAHAARRHAARTAEAMRGIAVHSRIADESPPLDYWVTDAREIARLKGIPDAQRVYLISFEDPERLLARGQRERLTVKVRQDRHAVILASVSLERTRNDNYIDHVVHMLEDTEAGSRLESELTLFAAAKIYGEFDFFFRVSCIDDQSLARFFEAIRYRDYGVNAVEIRPTITDRFWVTPRYHDVLAQFAERPRDLVLTWFERDPERDLFSYFVEYMNAGDDTVRPVEILETGEVIHHQPIYTLSLCESLSVYADFFTAQGLNPTACRSHIGQVSGPDDAQLRYALMSGIYLPSRSAS